MNFFEFEKNFGTFMNDDTISFLIFSSFIKLYIIIIKNLKYYIACIKD